MGWLRSNRSGKGSDTIISGLEVTGGQVGELTAPHTFVNVGAKQAVSQAGLGRVLERYRQSIMAELCFVWLLPFGAFWLWWGDGAMRVIGGVWLALGLIAAVVAWVKSRRHLYLCTGGLLSTDGRAVTNVVAWDDVESVRVWVTRRYKLDSPEDWQRCVLHLRDGRLLNLARPPYAHADRLAKRIERRVVEVAYPRRTAELDQTGATEFGPITVATDGIHYQGRLAVWQDITGMRRSRVRLRVWSATEHQPIISRQVRTIPDATVLMTMIAERAENVGIRE